MLVFFEIFFQLSEIKLPSYITDSHLLGRSLVPNARISYRNESFNLTSINEFGYLGKAYPKKKQSNVYRIAIIGDSYVEGLQVKTKHHFSSILENRLNSKTSNTKVEILNFGRSGLNFRSIYIQYELIAKSYNPDMIIIFVNESDFTDRNNSIGPKLIIHNDKLLIDSTFNESDLFVNKIKYTFLRNFSMYSFLHGAYANFKNGKSLEILLDKFYLTDNVQTSSKINNFDKTPFYDINKKIFDSYTEIEQSSNQRFIIIPIKELTEPTILMINNTKVKFIELNELYDYIDNTGFDPFYWQASNTRGHWNQQAHFEIGKFLANKLFAIIDIDNK